jgi:hypothetical protein
MAVPSSWAMPSVIQEAISICPISKCNVAFNSHTGLAFDIDVLESIDITTLLGNASTPIMALYSDVVTNAFPDASWDMKQCNNVISVMPSNITELGNTAHIATYAIGLEARTEASALIASWRSWRYTQP